METKANHILIGAFVLVMVAGAFGFVLWLAKVQIDREFNDYHVYFDGSVAGLSAAGEVRFNGIPVGSVRELVIDPDDARRVRVTIEVSSTTPVRKDTMASLELQGITGVSYVNLSSGDPKSAKLVVKAGQELPVIASRPSRFEELFTGAPRALDRFTILVDRATRFLGEENRAAVSGILADVKTLTGALAGRADKLAQTLDNVERTSGELRDAAGNVSRVAAEVAVLLESADATLAVARGTLAGADEVFTGDLRGLIDDTRATVRSVGRTSDELQALIAETREPLGEFSAEGLFEFSRLITETRFLVGSLSRLAEQLESDPAQFLFGDSERGFEAE